MLRVPLYFSSPQVLSYRNTNDRFHEATPSHPWVDDVSAEELKRCFSTFRGNSKYHYYGIRLKPDSALHNLSVNEENGNYTSRSNNGSGCQTQKRFRTSKTDSGDTQYCADQNHSTSSYQSDSSPEVRYS